MKNLVPLGALMELLPATLRDSIFSQCKEAGQDPDKLEVKRRADDSDVLESGERAAIKYVSTRTVDRDGEIIMPKGVNLREFLKYRHVLWNHNYSLPPIGSDEWIEPDDWGIKAKTKYADTGPGTLAEVVWQLVKQGHQKASSIGFVPLEWVQQGDEKFGKVLEKLEAEWPELRSRKRSVRRIYTKVMLLEHSDVSVPANVDATVVQVAKSAGADDEVLKMLVGETTAAMYEDAVEKTVVPYRKHPLAPEDRPWDAAAARRRIREWAGGDNWDPAKYRQAFVFVRGDPANLTSYVGPHHDVINGRLYTVWNGVRAAMASLVFGARGGRLPNESDRRGVYNHLAKHYREFDKEVPEFRDYSPEELDELFGEETGFDPEEGHAEILTVGPAVEPVVIEPVQVVEGDDVSKLVREEVNRIPRGRL